MYDSGTSTTVGPRFFVGPGPATALNYKTRVTKRRRPSKQLQLTVPVLLLVAEFAWLCWHTPTLPPESRLVLPIYKLLNHLRTEKMQPVRENKMATAAPQSQASARPEPTLGFGTVPGTAKVGPSRPTASLQLEQSLVLENPKARDQVIQSNQVSDDATAAVPRRAGMSIDDPDALVNLANMYLTGDGVRRNCDRATALLLFAASKPNVRARNRLAAMYATGCCVQRDRIQAYRWLTLTLAIKPGDIYARQNRNLTWRQMTPEERNIVELRR